ncbi:MAG TPA: PilZ domain-containing protein [Candidatus Sulfotelmatobacter sp.]|nr:PilZ domain-containing protein [Candidatus Sulfotelmatobacter sp.]
MEHERREYPRFKVSVPIELHTEENPSPIRGATTDLSLGGCYIDTFFPFPVGTDLELKVQLEDTLLVLGAVVTCDPQVGNGIRFTRMLPEDLEALQTFLEAKQKEQSKQKSD